MQSNHRYPTVYGLGTNDAVIVFGLNRPHLFRAVIQDRIRSVHIKSPVEQKGIRLIETLSLRNYINTFLEAI